MERCEAYKALPSDIAQEVLKKLHEAWKSYRALRSLWKADPKTNQKPGLPDYRKDKPPKKVESRTAQILKKLGNPKKERKEGGDNRPQARTGETVRPTDWIPIKCGRSYDVTTHVVSLTLPADLRRLARENGSKEKRLVLSHRGLERHKGQRGRAEVLYDRGRGRWYFRWSVKKDPRKEREWSKAGAIDLGVRVLASLSIEGEAEALHVSGNDVLHDWDYWGRQIALYQHELARSGRKASERLSRLHRLRWDRLRHAWEAIAARLVRRCLTLKVGTVYLGWPKDIRRDKDYGGLWNDRIHVFWSFDLALRILEKHFSRARILAVRVGERGSSSTCTLENVGEEPEHEVVRRPRHVLSCRTCGTRLHSDQAGSRNILRFSKPSVRWVGVEATPRTATCAFNRHLCMSSANRLGAKPVRFGDVSPMAA